MVYLEFANEGGAHAEGTNLFDVSIAGGFGGAKGQEHEGRSPLPRGGASFVVCDLSGEDRDDRRAIGISDVIFFAAGDKACVGGGGRSEFSDGEFVRYEIRAVLFFGHAEREQS